MARQPRFILLGQPQHIIIRGNNREAIFYGDQDYLFYLRKLKEAALKHDCQIHAYVLMTNHVHLLVSPFSENGISKLVQMMGRYYVQYFNDTYQRTGTLWEGRYKASPVDAEGYLLKCYQYIEMNPVRANMVQHCAEYPWSSYRANALGVEDTLVTPHDSYHALGRYPDDCQAAYRQLFLTQLDHRSLGEIRHAANKAWALGSVFFKEQIERHINRPATPRERGGLRRGPNFNRV